MNTAIIIWFASCLIAGSVIMWVLWSAARDDYEQRLSILKLQMDAMCADANEMQRRAKGIADTIARNLEERGVFEQPTRDMQPRLTPQERRKMFHVVR